MFSLDRISMPEMFECEQTFEILCSSLGMTHFMGIGSESVGSLSFDQKIYSAQKYISLFSEEE